MALEDLSAAHLAAQSGAFEEQRGNNGLLTIFGLTDLGNVAANGGLDILTLSLQSFPLPVNAIEAIETNFLNEKRKIAGAVSFEDMEVVYKDFVDIQTAQILKAWHETVYDPVTGKIGLARNYKKRGEIRLFAPDGSTERFWSIEGVFPLTANFGAIDMSATDPVKITMTLSIDKAYGAQQPGNANLAPQ